MINNNSKKSSGPLTAADLVDGGVPVGKYSVPVGFRGRNGLEIYTVKTVEDGYIDEDNEVLAVDSQGEELYIPFRFLVPATAENGWMFFEPFSLDKLLEEYGVSQRSLDLAREALTMPVDELIIPHQMFLQVAQAIEKGL